MIKLQCVGCKAKRDITLDEARTFGGLGPACPKCGMPEYAVSARVSSRRPKKGVDPDLRNVFK